MKSLIQQLAEKLEEILTAKAVLAENLDSLYLDYLHLNSKLSPEYVWSLFNAATVEEVDSNLQEISAYIDVLKKFKKEQQ